MSERSGSGRVRVTIAGGVADVRLSRPEKRNAPDPLAAALALATEIAGRSPHAIRAAKRLLDMAGRVDLATGFAAEQAEIGSLMGSPNQVEAVTATLGKRPPAFTD